MRIIEIRPSKRLGGSWTSSEGDGVQLAHKNKQAAIDYAKNRFGGGKGEIHVWDDASEKVVESIPVQGPRAFCLKTGSDQERSNPYDGAKGGPLHAPLLR